MLSKTIIRKPKISAAKVDLRIEGSTRFVTEAEGRKLKAKIKADGFIECSARMKTGLAEVIEESVRIAVAKRTRTTTCAIL